MSVGVRLSVLPLFHNAMTSMIIYRANHPGMIYLPECLGGLVNLVFHSCLELLPFLGSPGGQDHLCPLTV